MEIPFHKTHTGNEEINSIVEALKSGWLTMGPKTVEFENTFKEYIGSKHAVSFNSATAALHLALKAIGIKENDEVIIPTNTFIATAEVITYFNAKPILCDIEESTNNIDITKIENLITKETRAIMPVHFGGQPCDMDEINDIAKKNNLKVIEDAAHCLPTTYKDKNIGILSDITCFSFYCTKTLSTGEGGMATTDNDDYAKNMKINRLHGISRDAWDRYTAQGSWYYEVVDNGNKYNTTDLNSALGFVQLKKIDFLHNKRKNIAERYYQEFKNCSFELPIIKNDRTTSWHLFVIKVNNRNELSAKLKELGIGHSVHFIPVHMHPYYRDHYNYKKEDYPTANKIFERSLSLPIFPDMTDEEFNYIVENVKKYAK